MVWVRAVVSFGVAVWMVVAPFAGERGYPVGRAWRMYDGYGAGTCRVAYTLEHDGVAVGVDRLGALGEPNWAQASLATRRVSQAQLAADAARVCARVGPGVLAQQASCATATGWKGVAPVRRACRGRPL